MGRFHEGIDKSIDFHIERLKEVHITNEDRVDKQKRYRQIVKVMQGREPMTAKEIAVEMRKMGYIPTSERNFSAPRLTEMERMGFVVKTGYKKCQYTKKTVSLYSLVE